jgi:hypothetical protein
MTKAVHPIMARQAICPEIQSVGMSKVGINLCVTSDAVVLIIIGVAFGMAIDTTEGGSITFDLIGGQ